MNSKDLFNSPIENGARIVLLLAELARELDMDELIFLDYSAIYTDDFHGGPSLHPMLMNRLAELVRRREIFPDAIRLFTAKGLITSKVSEQGIRYCITRKGSEFAGSLSTEYHVNFRRSVAWVGDNIDYLTAQRRNLYKVGRDI
ncbi:ABC-three component system middle component 2 [Pseudomonas oryzihabitans]|uniref:ABC-three component system middle component 2 n=1 Tax=Pseudomonas oryzihabitans TaxID=47885 RepID=UPI002859195A|nr:ABC-three component system middle component 2 [Pseudomonas psychrotolerans]MDR6676121.1 hypothetical protein [Pseudomonas psychrotolerans]